jgi:TPR repeat protein
MYERGIGVKKNELLAKKYLKEACKNGNKKACEMYNKLGY